MKKINNLLDLVELQRELDFKTAQTRQSGFSPRPRTELDLKLALDDEFNEFMKELPDNINFKTWKEKVHSPEKQLEEFVDCFFFILALIDTGTYREFENCSKIWEFYGENLGTYWKPSTDKELVVADLIGIKSNFLEAELSDELMKNFIWLAKMLKYTKEQLIEAYLKKWHKNMGRPEKDWSGLNEQ